MEIWKDIKGFEGLYQISNYGRLKSFKVYPEGKILKLTNKNGDYFSVVLQGIGFKPRSTRIHKRKTAGGYKWEFVKKGVIVK